MRLINEDFTQVYCLAGVGAYLSVILAVVTRVKHNATAKNVEIDGANQQFS